MRALLIYPEYPDTFWSFNVCFAFMRSSIRLGIFGKERFQYWKILFRTLFRRPKMLPLAITLAIYGYHFRKVCTLKIAQ